MAEYKTIKGFKVQSLASDPSAPEGQVWYNTTSSALKYQSVAAGTWASGGTVPGAYSGSAVCGIQTAAIAAGGAPGPTANSYTYNGTSWTAVNSLTTARTYLSCAGIGTQGAAQVMFGETTTSVSVTEQYDGTSWSEVSDGITARSLIGGGGTQAAAIAMQGNPAQATVEDWDGTSWTTGTSAPQSKAYSAGGGTATSAITAGGGPPVIKTADTWDGTSWTEISDMNTARMSLARAAVNDSSAIFFGGEIPQRSGATEYWNGSTWTELADLAAAKDNLGGGGTSTLALKVGGDPSPGGATEEWNWETLTVKTVTIS